MKKNVENIILYIIVAAILVAAFLCNFKSVEDDVTDSADVTTEVAEESVADAALDDIDADNQTSKTTEPTTEEPTTELSEEELLQIQVDEIMSNMTLKEKVAQMFIIALDDLNDDEKTTELTSKGQRAFNNIPVGGVIFMEENLDTVVSTIDITDALQEMSVERTGLSMFISIDEEGGSVARISGNASFGMADVCSMAEVGATEDPEEAYNVGATIGEYLSILGFNLDNAPVADVLTNSSNKVIGTRSFGSDASLVASMVVAELEGLHSQNIYGVVKHFPGHGNTSGNTHKTTVVSDRTLEELYETDLVPFIEAIESGVEFIMVGHISLPNVTGDNTPATLSSAIVTDLLREDLGFEGIIMTDAMNMSAITNIYDAGEAAVLAVQAGCDIILMPEDYKAAYAAIVKAVTNGEITEERIDQSVARIIKAKLAMDVEDDEEDVEEEEEPESEVSSDQAFNVTSIIEINGNYFYFDEDGTMAKNGWYYIDGYKLYFDESGYLVTDVEDIIGPQSSYYIVVNDNTNVVTVYAADDDGEFVVPVKAFVCSVGGKTPTSGTYKTSDKYRWRELYGDCYGQWVTRITGHILFHSVPYYYPNNMTLETEEYNLLGTSASMGCVRLQAFAAKWIYDNCSSGTSVTFIEGDESDDPLPTQPFTTIPENQTWDPTDPEVTVGE